MTALRLGTRKSALAQAQARWVADQLRKQNPSLQIELILITTSGDERKEDANQSRVVGEGGLKALFTKEIEEALLAHRIDLAVHSLKDMGADLPSGLELAAVPVREDPRDVWISKGKVAFANLRHGARVATSAVRRQAQLRHLRPDLELVPMRGNIDTRLRKLAEEEHDGMILALAGLKRLGHEQKATEILPEDTLLPAIGQGSLAIEIRAKDSSVEKVVKTINHVPSQQAALAERAFLRTLGGSCQTPIAAHAKINATQMVLTGLVVGLTGQPYLRASEAASVSQAEELGQRLARKLLAAGAYKILS